MKRVLLLLASLLLGCTRYEPHDPSSYCLERQLEPRLRPSLTCKSRDPEGCRAEGVVVDFYWKCAKWSSW